MPVPRLLVMPAALVALLIAPAAAAAAKTEIARDAAANTISLTATDPQVSIGLTNVVELFGGFYLYSEQDFSEPVDTNCTQDGVNNWLCPIAPVRVTATLAPGDDYIETTGTTIPDTCTEVPVTVFGLAGYDTIRGGCGADVIDGGTEDDFIDAGDGNNEVDGGEGYDEITTGDGEDAIDGGDGGATIDSGFGNDEAIGGDGEDGIWTADGDDLLTGLGADDTLAGGDGVDTLTGGDGDDSLSGGGGNDTLDGDAGDDSLAGGDEDDTMSGGTGADGMLAGDGSDKLAGNEGPDRLSGGAGTDDLDGGDGADAIDGGEGNDALKGGGARDVLEPGTGTDTVAGGGDLDTVSYEQRSAGVTIALGGSFANGEPNEGDTIANDVENAIGGSGGDRITGDASLNSVDGLGGDDTIEPGGGGDFADAGAGNDTVLARDGAPDRIECGDGNDRAVTDAFDSTNGCETVEASRELMSDVDNDGAPAGPADCNDRDPLQRAGFPDRPGNGRDEDCSGGDAPYPRVLTGITTKYRLSVGSTRFTRLVAVDVPPEGTIELRCRGKGCFKDVKRRAVPAGAAEVNLTSLVNKAKLRPKAVLEVRVLRPETIGKVVLYTMQKSTQRVRKAPKSKQQCLRPGASAPGAC